MSHRICWCVNRYDSGSLYTARRTGVSEGKIDIAVLASGSGTNLQALIDTSDVASRIRIVVSDEAEAGALARATDAGIETAVVGWGDHPDRDRFSSAVADLIEESGAKGVVLAGFMRVLSASFVERFPDR
ncbi:MAG: formyltransferase family protein, partial [Acidimicrobiia bacterium]